MRGPVIRPLTFVVLSAGLLLSGSCAKSLRPQAQALAKSGSKTAEQLQDFYGLIKQDVIDTYELSEFRGAYLLQAQFDAEVARAKAAGQPPPVAPRLDDISESDKAIQAETQKSYNAIEARARLAGAIKAEYDAYGNLASYDAASELGNATAGLLNATKMAAAFAAPTTPGGGAMASVAQGILTDIVKQLEAIKQNKQLLRESQQMITLLKKYKQFFDAEKPLYGGDAPAVNSEGTALVITGIAGRKAAAYRSVASELVKSEAVVSTAMVERVLGSYDLAWPSSRGPFTEPALKVGILKMIAMRAYPIGQAATDAADDLSKSLGNLIRLHEQLAKKQTPSFAEALGDSATLQVTLDRMKVKSKDVKSLESIIQGLAGGK